MITKLDVENFKCLRNVSVDLSPFTVLIGANDSGKSSLLDAIRVLGRTTQEPLWESLQPEDGESTDGFDDLVWQRDLEKTIGLRVAGTSDGKTFEYSLQIRPGPELVSETLTVDGQPLEVHAVGVGAMTGVAFHHLNSITKGRKLTPILPAFASTSKYRLEPRALRRVLPFKSKPVLESSGDNLPESLDALVTGPDRAAIQLLESALHAAVPTLSGVALRTVQTKGNGTIGKELGFILAGPKPPITIPATTASEGALLLTAYLVLAYGETQEILLIEEPENGLHPTRLQTVIDLLRRISTGAVGNRPRQVIMTTHSPLLLNYVTPEEVRIVRRSPEGGTTVDPMTSVPRLDELLREFAVGELWYLLTEEGLMKGERP